jgi:hypothetical protein
MTQPSTVRRRHTVHRHPFTAAEDAAVIKLMQSWQFPRWQDISHFLPGRTPRQCRERWTNYLSPRVRSGPWTESEDQLLLERMNEFGSSWSTISTYFNGRSDNDVKNRWYSHLKHETVFDGEKYVFGNGEKGRAKRNRITISPKANALRVLQHLQGNGIMTGYPLNTNKTENSSNVGVVADVWDSIIGDGSCDEEKVELFD